MIWFTLTVLVLDHEEYPLVIAGETVVSLHSV